MEISGSMTCTASQQCPNGSRPYPPTMVHSPTDDLFNTQHWEHWAMLFILALGLVVGYGQAVAEDKRRAQRRRGGPVGKAVPGRCRRSRRKLRVESPGRHNAQPRQAIAPNQRFNSPGTSTRKKQTTLPRPNPRSAHSPPPARTLIGQSRRFP